MSLAIDLANRLRQAVQGCTLHSHGPVQALMAINQAAKDGRATYNEVAGIAISSCTQRVNKLLAEGMSENDPSVLKELNTRAFIQDLLLSKDEKNRSTPRLTVDVIIFKEENPYELVLISRKNPPLGWALPGGFVELGETVEEAAARESFEETNLRIKKLNLLGVYSDPTRDPRFHTVSTVFVAHAEGSLMPKDDAAEARYFFLRDLPDLVFDHRKIINDFLDKYMKAHK